MMKLASVPGDQGAMSCLMLKPTLKAGKDGWVKVRRVRLGKSSAL